MCLFSPLTSALSSHFGGPLTICIEASAVDTAASNRITSPCCQPSHRSKCKMWFTSGLNSSLQSHLSQSLTNTRTHACTHTFPSTTLGPYWIQLKVQRAVCHAAHCSRPKKKKFEGILWTRAVISNRGIAEGSNISGLSSSSSSSSSWPSWGLLQAPETPFTPSLTGSYSPHLSAGAIGPRGVVRCLMNGARASVPSLPSINLCGRAALKTNSSCKEGDASTAPTWFWWWCRQVVILRRLRLDWGSVMCFWPCLDTP